MSKKTEDDEYAYYTFKDLKERRIVNSRPALHFLIKDKGFPKPIKRGPTQQSLALWKRSAVHRYLDNEAREAAE
ncbi:hypothetical protein GOA97_18950 [Sinorhizobium meliloti]|nr:hypothetical protein [Sinorhizobium meliloti]MDW9656538.1 hypothetical protein [Sinorhizobium meliloti]MDW9916348.1 hypothetical protein [Sinorhizobium meliloti]MDW9939663.1 hypothetical protein [Sinorhizobium meliloti]MDW9945880.1 hypothetical protein [Sinorhizobium meliloti]